MIRSKKNGFTVVFFLEPYGAYAPGKIAGYAQVDARRLVEKGFARYATMNDIPEGSVDRVERFSVAEEVKDKKPKKAESIPVEEKDEDDPLSELTDDWHSMNGNKLRSIAAKVSAEPILTKDDAIAAIESALDERSNG